MQRVRIGLTGLALVFLLVLIGAMIRSVSDDGPLSANAIEAAGNQSLNEQEATETLAELGVAPGSTEAENAAASAPASNTP